MKKAKRLVFSWALTIVMVLSLMPAGIAFAADGAPAAGDIVILYTNDVHCGVDQVKAADGAVTNIGYAGVSAYYKEMQGMAGEGNVTLVDAGDAVQGDAIGTLSQGQYLVDIMNQIGYDVAVPGNHEFDYGMDRMLELMESHNAAVVSSNFTDLKTNKLVYEPYTIIAYGTGENATKVAYVGITTPESFTKSTPAYFQDDSGKFIYSFKEGKNGQELYDAVQDAIDAAKAEGADYVVAVGHLGVDAQSAPWRSTDVIAKTSGIDVFIDGHSHSTVAGDVVKNKAGEDVILTQTGTKLAAIGQLVITAAGDISTKLVTGYDKSDTATAAFIANIEKDFADDLAAKVGNTEVALTVNDPATGKRIVRNSETNLGDLCADAYRYILGNGKTGAASGPADIAFVNGGGVRANIDAGDITFGEVIAVHPFNNVGTVVEAKGQEILDALEMAARVAPEENGGFLQVSGLTYTIDTAVASTVVVDDKKSFVEVSGARRVKDVKVSGAAIDPAKVYTLASHNYMLLDGGDGINMFQDNKVVVQPVLLDNQILINYIDEYLDGVVGEEYSDPYGQDRINVTKAAADFTDTVNHWAAGAIRFAVDRSLFTGTTDSLFSPNAPMTRGMLVTVLHRYAGATQGAVQSFEDVAADKYYAAAVAWAAQNNIVTGADNKFQPDSNISREQMAAILYRYAAPEPVTGNLDAYPDSAAVSSWASDAMIWAVSSGLISGDDKGNLNPGGSATRAQVATILERFITNAEK
ncbi:MAG TPA: 5'-nucleotidase C-terminal domain-containing protein [Anaerovoracaceae bacterium]|nr:5'-nucleotidase C-terminal domain-containing protein [Anaerovoracaceae bacterium]